PAQSRRGVADRLRAVRPRTAHEDRRNREDQDDVRPVVVQARDADPVRVAGGVTMLPLASFALLAFTSLFTVINPISAAPIFVSMTDGAPTAERRRAALKSSLAAGATLLVFEAFGGLIFSFFGITVPAFQIAGGVLFTMISIKTLNNGREEVETDAGGGDPSIVPLAIPTIAGPGAISTV